MPTAAIYRKVNELNRSLRRDLGHPPFEWKWSEDLFITMADIEEDESGAKKFKYAMKAQPSGLIEMVRTHTRKLMCPSLPDRWVLCRKVMPDADDDRWGMTFGMDPDQIRNGMWVPCTNNRGQVVATERDMHPTIDNNNYVIECIRVERENANVDYETQFNENDAKAKRELKERLSLKYRDMAPAFGGIPGKKVNWAGGHSKTVQMDRREA